MVDRGRMVWGAGQGPRHLPYRASSNTGDTSSHDQQSDFLTVQWYIISAYDIYCTFNPAVRPTQLIYDWIFSSLILVFLLQIIFQWATTLRKYTDDQIVFSPDLMSRIPDARHLAHFSSTSATMVPGTVIISYMASPKVIQATQWCA